MNHYQPDKSAARTPNEYYHHLCQCSSFAIIGADRQGIIISWNRQAESIFDAVASKMLGRHIATIVPEGRRESLNNSIERAIGKKQTSEFEVDHRDKHGQLSTMAVVVTPVLDEGDEVIGVAAWIRDISNRKQLQMQLVHAEKMASLGTLAAGVAHHFNNIVGGVATFVDYALAGNDYQATQRALKMTLVAAERISKITSSLLIFAEKDMRLFDLSDITETILSFSHLVEKVLSEKNIELELNIRKVPVYEVPGTRIHEMLGNLLENAERAIQGEGGGKISIGLYCRDNDLIVEFSDNGCGIEPRVLPRIFEPFFTIDGVAGGGDQPCSGMGLAVVHGIVRELGGDIDVESTMGRGTTFTIRFPHKSDS